MKKLFVCLAFAGLLCGCGESGTDRQPDNGNAGLEPWDPVPIVGQWRLSLVERYASDGTLAEQRLVYYDPIIYYAFNEAGFFRCYDSSLADSWQCPYDGTYTYDTLTQRLDLDVVYRRRTSVTASYCEGCMRWIYETDENGYRLVEYYETFYDPDLLPPEKEEDMGILIPDPNFRRYMLSNYSQGDDILSAAEMAHIERMWAWEQKIASMEGIEYCTALTWLNCGCNLLTSLDVSHNTALKTLDCFWNPQMTDLNVSGNTALETLRCYGNQLTSLDVTHNTALKRLYCNNNQLTGLDVSRNTQLKELYGYNNRLTSLDVSNCKQLKILYLNPMPSLKTLYMAKGQIIDNMSISKTTEIIYK